jgi:hypothetical protein
MTLVARPKNSDNLQDWVTAMHDGGVAWADAKLVYTQLDLDRKSYLADLINTIARLNEKEKLSDKKLENLALAQTEYRTYCRNLAIAEHEMLKKRVRYDSLIAAYESERTRAATERQKLASGVFHQGG